MTSRNAELPTAIVTVAEAAERAGRSIAWVRMYRRFGPLEPAELNGRQAVTLPSLDAFVAELQGEAIARRQRRRPKLRLVVDNTGK
jgi:hypothetical protein